MIVQCPACRALVEVEAFESKGTDAGFACPECEAFETIPLNLSGAVVQAYAPKVSEAQRGPATKAANAPTPGVDLETVLSRLAPDGDVQEHLVETFRQLGKEWGNAKRHHGFIQKAALDDELAFAGICYREVLQVDPENEAALKARDMVMAQAMAHMKTIEASPEARDGKELAVKLLTLVTFIFFIGSVIMLIRTLMASDAEPLY